MTTTNPRPETEIEAQLIDTLLRTAGKGADLLQTYGSLLRLAQNLDGAKLTEKQREQLRAAFELRFLREPRPQINCPADIYCYVTDLQIEPQEHFVVLIFDTRNNLLHRENLYHGSLNTSMIRLAEVFRPAIVHHGASIAIVHNHPSGDPSPSPEDVSVTRAIVETGKALDIHVLDHIVVGADRYVSLKERGLGF